MQARFQRKSQQLMPRRVEFNFVDAVTETIKRVQLWGKSVGVKTELDGLWLAKCRAQGCEFILGPAGTFAPYRFAEHDITRKYIVRLKRWWLVLDFEHCPLGHSGT
jgi:hypothetical protein